jgi:hypothetical protein
MKDMTCEKDVQDGWQELDASSRESSKIGEAYVQQWTVVG